MNNTTNSLLIIAIIFVVIMLTYNCTEYYTQNNESFTNDEAIQNIASLYNQAQLSVTNFTSTGKGTFNDLNAATIKSTGAIGAGSANVTGNVTAGSANITGGLTAGSANVTGNLTTKSMGPDKVFIGNWPKKNIKDVPLLSSGTVLGTQDSSYNAAKNSMCPNGSYMVGLQKGSDWDWYYPICRSFA